MSELPQQRIQIYNLKYFFLKTSKVLTNALILQFLQKLSVKLGLAIPYSGKNAIQENLCMMAQSAENIGINSHRAFERLLCSLNTRTLCPKSSHSPFSIKKQYNLWIILLGCLQIMRDYSYHSQGVSKSQRKLIRSSIGLLEIGLKILKLLDLNRGKSSATFCSNLVHIERTVNAAKKIKPIPKGYF